MIPNKLKKFGKIAKEGDQMKKCFCTSLDHTFLEDLYSLGNPGKDRQRFVDAIALISALDWSERLSNFENVVQTPFEFGLQTSNDTRFCQTV